MWQEHSTTGDASRQDQHVSARHAVSLSHTACVPVHELLRLIWGVVCRMVKGQRLEPLEEVMCEIEDEYSGPVIDALSLRRGEVISSLSCLPDSRLCQRSLSVCNSPAVAPDCSPGLYSLHRQHLVPVYGYIALLAVQ